MKRVLHELSTFDFWHLPKYVEKKERRDQNWSNIQNILVQPIYFFTAEKNEKIVVVCGVGLVRGVWGALLPMGSGGERLASPQRGYGGGAPGVFF